MRFEFTSSEHRTILRFKARGWHGTTGNFWQSAFNAVGIPVFSPVCGASAFLTMRLSLDLLRAGNVVYCSEQDGSACRQCPKCLRREMIRAVVDPRHRPQWTGYDNPASMGRRAPAARRAR